MTKAPHDLTGAILHEIRGDLTYLRKRADETTTELKTLTKQIPDWQETTATATGLAMHANIRGQALENELADIRSRLEKLEQAK
jgi:septal ring factor EnvC (AmiA/AmiB activator)